MPAALAITATSRSPCCSSRLTQSQPRICPVRVATMRRAGSPASIRASQRAIASPALPSSRASPTASALVARPPTSSVTRAAVILLARRESLRSSDSNRALSVPIASTRASIASGSTVSDKASAVRCTSWRCPEPSQAVGKGKLCSRSSPCLIRFCSVLVVLSRPSGLLGFTSTR